MNGEIKVALKEAIMKCLPVLQKYGEQYQEPYCVWSKRSDGAWLGKNEQRPSLALVFQAAGKNIEEADAKFSDMFFSVYPKYRNVLIGCSSLVGMQISGKAQILRSAIGYLWEKHQTFERDENSVDTVVNDFAEFVDSPTIRARFQSELLNYRMISEGLDLPDGLVIRTLSEREVCGFENRRRARHEFHGICEFVIEGEFDGVKTFSGKPETSENPLKIIMLQLIKCLRSLRTFKEGPVGIGWLHLTFTKFWPLSLGSYWSFDRFVPPGNYTISDDEVERFCTHARSIFVLSDSAMEAACARLSDAEGRFRPQDQILDAVIGMEALLLATAGKEEYRGELRLRFSLNYSTLFQLSEEKWRAYKVAKDLYDLRSKIAHGGDVANEDYRLGQDKFNLQEIAKQAKNSLRMVIQHFLPQLKNAPYKRSEFWEKAYFNIS